MTSEPRETADVENVVLGNGQLLVSRLKIQLTG